jgi:hypothetical protein
MMDAKKDMQVRVVNTENTARTLWIGVVTKVYKDGGFVASCRTTSMRFTRNGIEHGQGGKYNGQTIHYAYPM